ncbi:ScyD/ScyE family protein [Cellulomonas rhizosphaerae]|uniref:ScyD/ScyE family protein n=1 Tax=Cellulomonas rhizosphaerae TaxID=2293719 RepID=A0A413RHL3_9CELL|nr:ScyD/ScyE family protein [Cellulomonas rhizosphaerae]RHA37639.1 ScyD/ScyE family protein [Cellulomonas rhizosphaerae]
MRLRTCAVSALAVAGLVIAGAPATARSSDHHTSGLARVAHYGHGVSLPDHRHPVKSHHAPRAGTPTTVATGLAGPLTFGVGAKSLYVGQAFAGIVSKIPKTGAPTVVGAATPGADAAGVEVSRGALTWTERAGEPGAPPTASLLHRQTRDGATTVDLLAYEQTANPDQKSTYGFRNLDAACAAQLDPMFQSYTGGVDSHAYGTLHAQGATYVADAGANAIFKVSAKGKVSTVAVLKAVPVVVPAAAAAALGLPACVAGKKYWFEPVPTDVEQGRDGWLYVSLLPGGPEDGSLGANGQVVKVNPRTGKVLTVAKGLAGATGLAVGPKGTVYVAQLNGNAVSWIDKRGTVRPLLTLTQPAGVEWAHGKLWVSTDVFGAGSIISVKVH